MKTRILAYSMQWVVAGNLEDWYIPYISQKLAHPDLGKPEELTSHLIFPGLSQTRDKGEILWERGIWSMKSHSFRDSFRKRVELLVVALLIKRK